MLLPWMVPKSRTVRALLDKLPDDARALCLSARWGDTTKRDVEEFMCWWNFNNPREVPKVRPSDYRYGLTREGWVRGPWFECWMWAPITRGPEDGYRGEHSGWYVLTRSFARALRELELTPSMRVLLKAADKARLGAMRAEKAARQARWDARVAPSGPRHVLGVGMKATSDEIKLAYRRLASVCHPDRGGDVGRMQEINAAYAALT